MGWDSNFEVMEEVLAQISDQFHLGEYSDKWPEGRLVSLWNVMYSVLLRPVIGRIES